MCETGMLRRLEELAIRKASVYGRTLTDMRLAEEMKSLAKWHEERLAVLASLEGEVLPTKGENNNET